VVIITLTPSLYTVTNMMLLFVAHMMVILDGKERTAKEWTALLAKHGFKVLQFVRTIPGNDFHLIEAVRL